MSKIVQSGTYITDIPKNGTEMTTYMQKNEEVARITDVIKTENKMSVTDVVSYMQQGAFAISISYLAGHNLEQAGPIIIKAKDDYKDIVMSVVTGFMEMQQNNKSIVSNHMQAATYYALGKFNKVNEELSKCGADAVKNEQICIRLVQQSKNLLQDLRKGQNYVRGEYNLFKAQEKRKEEIITEKEDIKKKIKICVEECKRKQKLHDERMKNLVDEYEKTMKKLMDGADEAKAEASAQIARNNENLKSLETINTMKKEGWWVFSYYVTDDNMVKQKQERHEEYKRQLQKAANAYDEAQKRKIEALYEYNEKRIAANEQHNKDLKSISLEAIQYETELRNKELDLIKEDTQIAKSILDTLKRNGFTNAKEFTQQGLYLVIMGLERCTNAIESYKTYMEGVKNQTIFASNQLKKLEELYNEVQNDLATPLAQVPKNHELILIDQFKDSMYRWLAMMKIMDGALGNLIKAQDLCQKVLLLNDVTQAAQLKEAQSRLDNLIAIQDNRQTIIEKVSKTAEADTEKVLTNSFTVDDTKYKLPEPTIESDPVAEVILCLD